MKSNTKLFYSQKQLAKAYYIAKKTVIDRGFASEIDWQYNVNITNLDEHTFLQESAWVILYSGMREAIVRRKFVGVSQAFLNWESAKAIYERSYKCSTEALLHFRNPSKINAILSIATHIYENDFDKVIRKINQEGISYLQQFPYIGKITSFHLAKNIGLPVAKPDRHLCRIAFFLNYTDVQTLCEDIAFETDEPVSVVDLVLWRYSTLYPKNIVKLSKFLKTVRNSAHN